MSKIKDTLHYLSSFAGEQLIAHYPSKFGPDIEVCLINGRYQINAGSVNYSFGPLHDAFRRYFNLDPPQLTEEAAILILGFGAGSVASILRSERNLPNPITGVELDAMMVKAGQEHFNMKKLADIDIVIGDAFEFIQNCDRQFNLIVVDIYIDDKVPDKFMTDCFIKEINRCLSPEGKLVFNKLVSDEKTSNELKHLEEVFKRFFKDVKTIKIPINKFTPNMMVTGKK
jgi:spermidine synthase